MLKSLGAILAVGMLLLLPTKPGQAEDTVLELWANRAPDDTNARGSALKHVLDDFEAKHPGVKIKVTVIDYKDLSPTLLRAARANQVPDIAMLYSPYVQAHIAAGSIQPLDGFMTDDIRKNVIPVPVAQKDGKTYGLPWEIRVMGYLYRKDLFEQAGTPTPETQGQLVETLKKIRAQSGMEGYGVSFDPVRSVGAIEWFIPMAVGMGAKVLNDDGTAAFNDPAIVKLLESFHALVQNDKVIDYDTLQISVDEMQQRFEAGKVAMYNDGTHALGETREASGLGLKVAFAPIPGFDADHPTPALLQGWILVIPTGSKHADLAWELIKHWTSAEIQKYQTLKVGYMPGNRQLIGDPELDKPELAHIKLAFAAIDKGILNFNWPENSELLNDVLSRMVAAVVSDKESIPDAIAEAEKAYNSHLN